MIFEKTWQYRKGPHDFSISIGMVLGLMFGVSVTRQTQNYCLVVGPIVVSYVHWPRG